MSNRLEKKSPRAEKKPVKGSIVNHSVEIPEPGEQKHQKAVGEIEKAEEKDEFVQIPSIQGFESDEREIDDDDCRRFAQEYGESSQEGVEAILEIRFRHVTGTDDKEPDVIDDSGEHIILPAARVF
jgi:predicted component of type VI protein secretion system